MALLRQGLRAGAIGFATSKAGTHVGYQGKPVPSRVAEIEEIYALAEVMGEEKRGIMQATAGRELTFEQFAEINRRTGRTVTWTALLAGLALAGGDHEEQLARTDQLVADGFDVVPQVTPRPLNFGSTLY